MKIGIITYHWLYNFGANLQILATVKYLQKLGHEVCVLNYRPPELVEKYQKTVPSIQADAHQQFCELYLPESSVCANQEDIIKVATEENFDVVISGSDAVLRLWTKNVREDTRFPNPFWLTWTEELGIKRKGILAGSSMGTNYFLFPPEVRSGIRNTLRTMDYISIRDRWTQILLSTISRNQYQLKLCPDPVVMLNEVMSVPEKYGREAIAEKNQYILLSVYKNTVSDRWVSKFVETSHLQGLKVYSLPLPEYEVLRPVDKVINFPLSPLEWYAWIQNAAAYVGVRFHPIVCALVNGVPFVALDQYEMQLKRRLIRVLTRPLFRFSSKTYDLCWRAKCTKNCLNPKQYQQLSPQEIFGLVQEQLVTREINQFVFDAQATFTKAVSQIIDD